MLKTSSKLLHRFVCIMEAPQRIPLQLDQKNAERAKRFFEAYTSAALVAHPDTPTYLGTKSPRRCRFCKRSRPEVAFKSEAHVLPQFMGNQNLLSYFECDSCNNLFSTYEASFARFIGAARTISQIRGQKDKVPTFIDPANGIELKMGEHALQFIVNGEQEGHTVDLTKMELTISTVRHPYVPLHILKTLIKIGFCLLDEEEVLNYEFARLLLASTEYDDLVAGHGMFHLRFYFLPGPVWFSTPAAQLYALDPDCPHPMPGKQLILYYGNYCFQVAMPFGESEDARLLGKTVKMPWFPLLVNHDVVQQYGEYQEFEGDFTSAQRRSGEPHELTCSISDYVRVDPDANELDIINEQSGPVVRPSPVKKHLTSTILNTVQTSPGLLQAAGIYCNFAIGYDNLFAEQHDDQTRVFVFNADNGLYLLDTAELQQVFRLRSLSATTLRRLPLDYLVSTLHHCQLVYQSYFKDDLHYAANISWAAHATAREKGATTAEAKRYMWLVDSAFGCLGYPAELTATGLRVVPRAYKVQPVSMNRNLTGLAKLGLLQFTREADTFNVRLAQEHLIGLKATAAPVLFGRFLY
jgi:hypothetical protein